MNQNLKNQLNELVVLMNKPFDFDDMNDSYQQTFRLGLFGLTNQEIADEQNLSLTNVSTRFWTLNKKHGINKNDLSKKFFERLFHLVEDIVEAAKEEEVVENV